MTPPDRLPALKAAATEAYNRLEAAVTALEHPAPGSNPDELKQAFNEAYTAHQNAVENVERREQLDRARSIAIPDTHRKSGARVTRESLTYERGNGQSFFRDLLYAHRGDLKAAERLSRHTDEMRVEHAEQFDLSGPTDSTGGALVAPAFLQDEFGELARAGRPTVNAIGVRPVPMSDTINVPKMTAGTTVDVQASENTAVSETDPTFDVIAADVKTIAGICDVSLQLVERGVPGTDEIIWGDLARAYNTKFDLDVLNANTTNYKGIRNTTGVNTVTYTDATPTLGELYPKIADAARKVAVGVFLPSDLIVVHPRRWAWMLAALDTSNRPLIVPTTQNPFNSSATMGPVSGEGIVGTLQGMPIIVDASVVTTTGAGTNEDEIYVLRRSECLIWEDPRAPLLERFDDTGSATLTARFRARGYVAFAFNRRPLGITKITGTGLTDPTL